MSQYSGKITFYEGKCFTGRRLDVCGTCCSFQDRGFLNRVNSICVRSGAWVCFAHPNLRGQQYVLEHGEYPHFHRWNGRGDRLGSCRPVGMVSDHLQLAFGAMLGTRDLLWGTRRCCCLRGSNHPVLLRWVLYEEPNYRGRMYVVERGEFSSFRAWQACSSSIQSVRRVVNYV
uniref:Crystallin gamma N n=1 Tax=Anas platyrhynchos platyrhynchos TaxID=8840 RepID=U3J271_ANAPP